MFISEKQQDVSNVKDLHGYSIESPIRSIFIFFKLNIV